jgi:hypothetical protein
MWGWCRAIKRAIAWCYALPERAARKVFFGVISWLHPELNRIEDEDERYWAALISEVSREPPRWKVYLFFMLFCVIFPMAGAVVAILIAPWLRTNMDSRHLLLGGYATGTVVPLTLWLLLRRRRVRQAHIRTLRNLGYDMCPECRYDMTGHAFEARYRTCPECGAAVAAECRSVDEV